MIILKRRLTKILPIKGDSHRFFDGVYTIIQMSNIKLTGHLHDLFTEVSGIFSPYHSQTKWDVFHAISI
jgi:hypothetical protein